MAPDHIAIEEAAAIWLMRSGEPVWSSEDEAQLELWLEESMAHKAAFWRLQKGYLDLDRLKSLPQTGPVRRSAARSYMWPAALAGGLAAAAIMAAVWLVLLSGTPPSSVGHYETATGEIGSVALADGTEVSLNSGARIRVLQTPSARILWLDSGEAYFAVSKDPNRPFVIHAGRGDVTVLGTKFSVSRSAGRVTVSVVNGKVRLDRPWKPGASTTVLAPGEIATTDGTATYQTFSDVETIEDNLAWRHGDVTFDDVSLAQAAAYFNRYNDRKIVVSGSIGDVRIGGTFELANIDGFSRLLEHSYGMRVRSDADTIKISAR